MHARPVEATRDLLDGLVLAEVTARSGVVTLVQDASFEGEVVGDVEASGVFVVEVAALDTKIELGESGGGSAKEGDVGRVGAIGEMDVEEKRRDSVEARAGQEAEEQTDGGRGQRHGEVARTRQDGIGGGRRSDSRSASGA